MSTGKERQKQLAREHYERQMQRRAEREARAKRTAVIGSTVGVVVVVGGIVAATTLLSGNNDGATQSAADATPTAAITPTGAPTEAPQVTPSPIDLKTVSCAYTKDAQGKSKDVGLPPAKPNLKARTMTVKTGDGDIVIDLQPKKAPCTVNSFDYLASKDYFDNTRCHRLVTPQAGGLAVLQCGDPLAKADGKSQGGDGGPGYKYADENLGGMPYKRGVVAMANAGAGTNGSQFFIVFGDETASLPPQYTPFGTVTKGMEIVDKVAKGGFLDDQTAPKVPVEIKDVTISGKS
ncbi:peptidylprolyl isomerase [Nonomuraea sp. NPDC046570]|uniref:peptidylprolyl isomerase n=1 Tax=Nonomuraea sp. NPDC046570 TaxID=3155255 RepID=UPI00340F1C19